MITKITKCIQIHTSIATNNELCISIIEGAMSEILNRPFVVESVTITPTEEYTEYTFDISEEDDIMFQLSDCVTAFNNSFNLHK